MLTLILCFVLIVLICSWRWDKDDYVGLWFLVCFVILVFGVVFPLWYGDHMANNSPGSVTVHAVSAIEGKYYYLTDNGAWRDVLLVGELKQSEELKVVTQKAPVSVWYWEVSRTKAYISIGKVE